MKLEGTSDQGATEKTPSLPCGGGRRLAAGARVRTCMGVWVCVCVHTHVTTFAKQI